MAAGCDAVGQEAFVEDGGEFGAGEVDGCGVGGGARPDDYDAGVHFSSAVVFVEDGAGGGGGVRDGRGGALSEGGEERGCEGEGEGRAEGRGGETREDAGKQLEEGWWCRRGGVQGASWWIL